MKRFNKNPLAMDGLLKSALSRHNIGRQVTSALVVEKANEVLYNLVDMMMKPDVKVVSYKRTELLVACRHPAAVHAMQAHTEELKQKLETFFPSLSITRVACRTQPDVWSEPYHA